MFQYVVLLFTLMVEGVKSDYNFGRQFCVNQSNPDDGLAFVNPAPIDSRNYPVRFISSTENRYSLVHCCGTGFTSVRWYLNNTLIKEGNPNFSFKERGQVMHWARASPVGASTLTCELVKNKDLTLPHHMRLWVVASCQETRPYFTILPNSPCASVGDNVSIECEIKFGDDKCTAPIFKFLQFYDSIDTFISPVHKDYSNAHVVSVKADDRAISVHATLTFTNITEKQLHTKYYCIPRKHDYVKADFEFLGPCKPTEKPEAVNVPKYFDEELAVKIAIPLLLVTCVLIVFSSVIYLYRREISLLWNKYITPTNKGNRVYDAYIVCSKEEKDEQFFTEHMVAQLQTYYTLCIPDRDFLIGSVIPEQMCEYINKSKRVLVVSSASVLQTDYCDLSLNVAIANNIPLIFIKPPYTQDQQEADKFAELVSDSPEISAALATSEVISYPKEPVKKDDIVHFYNRLYKSMPLAHKRTGKPKIDEEKLA